MRLHAAIIAICALLAVPPLRAQELPPPSPDDAPGYRLGEGLRVGGTPLLLGGYLNAVASDLVGAPEQLTLDELALMASWDDGGRFSALSEVELRDGIVLTEGQGITDDLHVVLQRFHVDYAFDDRLRLRVGKFLTPIGRWNTQLHAAPLSWTTSKPLIIETTFPENLTGAMLHGTLPLAGRALDYAAYGSIGEELLADPDIEPFTEAAGGRLAWGSAGSAQLGLSYAQYEQRDLPDEHKVLYGADFEWQLSWVELTGEFVWRKRRTGKDSTDEQGYYVQAVVPLVDRWYGVGRFDTFRSGDIEESVHRFLGGVAWRLRPGLVLKAEYSHAVDNDIGADEGLQASFAMMF